MADKLDIIDVELQLKESADITRVGGILMQLLDNLTKSAIVTESNLKRMGLNGLDDIKKTLDNLNSINNKVKDNLKSSAEEANKVFKDALNIITKTTNELEKEATKIKTANSLVEEGTLAYAKQVRQIELINAKKLSGYEQAKAIAATEEKSLNYLKNELGLSEKHKEVKAQLNRVAQANINLEKEFSSINNKNMDSLKQSVNNSILHNIKLNETNSLRSKGLDKLKLEETLISQNLDKAKQISDVGLRDKTINSLNIKLAETKNKIYAEELKLIERAEKAQLKANNAEFIKTNIKQRQLEQSNINSKALEREAALSSQYLTEAQKENSDFLANLLKGKKEANVLDIDEVKGMKARAEQKLKDLDKEDKAKETNHLNNINRTSSDQKTNEAYAKQMAKLKADELAEYHNTNKQLIIQKNLNKGNYDDAISRAKIDLQNKAALLKYDVQEGLVLKGSVEYLTRVNQLIKEGNALRARSASISSTTSASTQAKTNSSAVADIASSQWEALSRQTDVTALRVAQTKLDIMKQQYDYNIKNKVFEADSVKDHEARKRIAEAEVALARATTTENEKQLEIAGRTMTAVKRALGYSALFAGVAAATSSFQAAVQGLIEYDKMLYTFQAVLDVSAEKAKKLEENMTGLSIAYGEQLSSLNKVALELGRAGTKYEDLAQGTKIVTQLAILTGDSVESSTGALVTYLQVFGKDQFGKATASVEELGAKLAFLANSSKMNTQDINTFSNYALSTAKAVGMTIDQVNGLAVALNNAGKNASTVGTNIRRFSEMLGDTNPKVKEFFQSIGVNQATLQQEISKGGDASNKAFIGFIDRLKMYSKESINMVLNGADTLMRDTILSIANAAPEITKAFGESMDVTSNEINKADLVTKTFERSIIGLTNTIVAQFHSAQPALSVLVDGLTWLVENFKALTLAVGSYIVVSKSAEISNLALIASERLKAFHLKASTVAYYANIEVTRAMTFSTTANVAANNLQAVSIQRVTYLTRLATLASRTFVGALLTNPLILGAAGIAAGIYAITTQYDKYKSSLVDTTSEIGKNTAEIIKQIEANDKLSESAKKAQIAQAIRKGEQSQEAEDKKAGTDIAGKSKAEYEKLASTLYTIKGKLQDTSLPSYLKEAYEKAIPLLEAKMQELSKSVDASALEIINKAPQLAKAATYFTEAFTKKVSEELDTATRLTKLKGTEALGFKMMDDLASSVKTEANKQMPLLFSGILDEGLKNEVSKDWNALGNTAGINYLVGVNKTMSTLQNKLKGMTPESKGYNEIKASLDAIKNVQDTYAKTQEKELSAQKSITAEANKEEKARERLAELHNKIADTQEQINELLDIGMGTDRDSTGYLREKLRVESAILQTAYERYQQESNAEFKEKLYLEYLTKEKSYLETNNKYLAKTNDELTKRKATVEQIQSDISKGIETEQLRLGIITQSNGAEYETLRIKIREAEIGANGVKLSAEELDNLKAQLEQYRVLHKQKKDLYTLSREYQKELEDMDTAGYNAAKAGLSSLESGMMDFFDITSQGWLNWHSLASNVLSSIYKQLLEQLVIKQMVAGIAGGLSSMFSSTPSVNMGSTAGANAAALGIQGTDSMFAAPMSRYNGGYIGYASGGLLTGGSGVRDDLYLGQVNGTQVFAMGGEFITRKDSVNPNTRNTLEYINQTGQVPNGGGSSSANVNVPVSVNIENQTGQNITADMIQSMTKQNSNGDYEKVVNIVLKAAVTDPRVRSILKGK